MFLVAGLLLGLLSSIAFVSALKEKGKKRRSERINAFLADKKRALGYYNVLSSLYDVLNPYLYTSSMRNKITSLLSSDKKMRVLDVGCGTGYTTRGILKLDNLCEVVGIDQNHRQLKKAAKNLFFEQTRASLSRGDVENLPFANETFDATVSVGAVEYFPDPAMALKEMARVTKEGGKVVVGGPEYNWFRKFFLHRFFYTPETRDFGNKFLQAGLEKITSELTGVNTFFGTHKYVLIVTGTRGKSANTMLNYISIE